jgi:ABC-type uncharacterized transport system involved in gliding motility auxiliary subunit
MTARTGGSDGRPRAWRHWLETGTSTVLLVALLAAVQVVAERRSVRLDLTPSRRLSLSDATRRVLGEVAEDLSIEAYHSRWQRQETADLLARLAAENARVRYDLYDIDRYPERARAAGIRDPGRARVTYRGAHTVVSTASEEYLAGGIVRVLRGGSRRVYFVRGHGERGVDDAGDDAGYWQVARALERENASVASLDLAAAGALPTDAAAVVVAGPRGDLSEREVALLEAYVRDGGALLVLLDPAPLPRLAALLARYGIEAGEDVIVDESGRLLGAEALVVRVPYYRMHPVTAPSDVPAVLVGARTIDVPRENRDAQSVARSAESAWATPEIDAARRGEVSFREGRDRRGPLPVMAAVTVPQEGDGAPGGARRPGRLVAIGDADFGAGEYLDLGGNRDLLLNSVSWLTDEEALIARRPRELAEIARPLSPLVLTERQAHGIFLAAVVLEPALVLAIGGAVVARRRRRG